MMNKLAVLSLLSILTAAQAANDKITWCQPTCSSTNPWNRVTKNANANAPDKDNCSDPSLNRESYIIKRHGETVDITGFTSEQEYWAYWNPSCSASQGTSCCEHNGSYEFCCTGAVPTADEDEEAAAVDEEAAAAPTTSPTTSPTITPPTVDEEAAAAPTTSPTITDEEAEETDEYGCPASGRRLQTIDLNNVRQLLTPEVPICPETAKNSLADHPDLLQKKWGITDPTFASKGLDFALCYGVSDMIVEDMADWVIYTNDCKTPATSGALTVNQDITGAYNAAGTGDRSQNLNISINPTVIPTSNLFTNGNGSAKVEFCVRNRLSIQGAQEINFLETIVTLNVDLKNCFDIKEIDVKPLEKDDQSTNEDFKIRGFLCDENNFEIETTSKSFAQGEVIKVCVTPEMYDATQDSIFMRYIESFAWTLRGDTSVTQTAVAGPNTPGPSGLSSVDCQSGDLICSFDTILNARFYVAQGFVDGQGTAVMQIGNTAISRRNLRKLQESAGPTAEVNMEVSLSGGGDEFRAASGASSITTSLLALVAMSTTAMFYM